MSPVRESHYIAAYLRRKFDFIRKWTRRGTLLWVQWYMRHGRCLTMYLKGRLVGVTMLRFLDEPMQGLTDYFDTGGRVAYIETTACDRGMMPPMFKHLRLTFPALDTICWVRSKHQNRPVIFPISRVTPKLLARI